MHLDISKLYIFLDFSLLLSKDPVEIVVKAKAFKLCQCVCWYQLPKLPIYSGPYNQFQIKWVLRQFKKRKLLVLLLLFHSESVFLISELYFFASKFMQKTFTLVFSENDVFYRFSIGGKTQSKQRPVWLISKFLDSSTAD